jgi:hypothetical protein
MDENVKTAPLTRDAQVKLYLEQLQAKKDELARAEKPNYITGGKFRFSEDVSRSIDITLERDERKLVEILTFLKDRSARYPEAASELKSKVVFTWLGFTYEEWFRDLQTRVNINQISQRRKEVEDLEIFINTLISPELRLEMDMELAAVRLKALGL